MIGGLRDREVVASVEWSLLKRPFEKRNRNRKRRRHPRLCRKQGSPLPLRTTFSPVSSPLQRVGGYTLVCIRFCVCFWGDFGDPARDEEEFRYGVSTRRADDVAGVRLAAPQPFPPGVSDRLFVFVRRRGPVCEHRFRGLSARRTGKQPGVPRGGRFRAFSRRSENT